jgi:tetratricopeptide (TPR) repeat protein
MRAPVILIAVLTLPGLGCLHGGKASLFGTSERVEPEVVAGTQAKSENLPNKPTALLHITMAEDLEKKGMELEAIAYYEKARGLDPELEDRASRRLAVLYDKVDEQAKAMNEFQEQLKKRPKDASLLNDVGYSYYNRALWSEAELHLRKAVTQDKNFKPAWVNLGLALAQQGKQQESLEAFSHAVSAAEAWSNIGFVLAVQNKKPEALAAYRKALELEPALKIAQAAIQRLEAAEAAAAAPPPAN